MARQSAMEAPAAGGLTLKFQRLEAAGGYEATKIG